MAVGAVAVAGRGPEALVMLERVVAAGVPARFTALPGTDPRRGLEAAVGEAIARGRLDGEIGPALLAGVSFDDATLPLEECDLVVEAERAGLHDKVRWLRILEARMAPGAVLAACSGTLPVRRVANRLERPAQFLAFELPEAPPRFALIHATPKTAPGATEALRHFLRSLGLTPSDAPMAGPAMARPAAAWTRGHG